MGVKVGTSCLHWTQPSVRHPTQTLASLKRCSFSDGVLACKHIRKLHRTATRTHRRLSPIRRVCSASADSSAFSDEEFAKQLQELEMRFHTNGEQEKENNFASAESESNSDYDSADLNKPDRKFVLLETSDWQDPENGTISANIEWKANSVDLPLSLRMIKRKRQWQEGLQEASESAYCSVKKAFSSMVFIIRELHCFTIQMREAILYEDLRGILSRVQAEMHASFVWLFQHVFSHTPTLMVYVMILLANYSVHSMSAVAAPPPPPPPTESVSILEYRNSGKFDQSSVRDFSLLSNSGKTASVSGSGGGGGNLRPVSSSTDGGGSFWTERMIVPDGVREEESVSGQEMGEGEVSLWNSIVDEAVKMQSELRDKALDHETVHRFVSPVSAKVETDEYPDYFRTELFYRVGLAEDPMNPLLLANYAQFLYLVAHDHVRAEEYFKRAVKVEPPDAETLSKYASFLWQAKTDLWTAEETYLEAISADPTNSYYAANYAHFLWSTGGEDTCFPLDGCDGDL